LAVSMPSDGDGERADAELRLKSEAARLAGKPRACP
jgi:hypothetical protein